MKKSNLFYHYVWLIDLISKRGSISLEEINQQWMRSDINHGAELSRHAFRRYKNDIADMLGIDIECERKTNRYFISNPQVLRNNSVQRWILSALSVSNIIKESLSLQDSILLENIHIEEKQLSTIINAMKRRRRISFLYQKYGESQPTERLVTPCCIKLFRQRWYVIDFDPQRPESPFKPFAFDRISKLELTDQPYELPADFNAETIFTDAFGIFIGDVEKPLRIVVRAYDKERFYMRDLPLHHSQEIIKEGDAYTDYQFFVRPSKDFIAELLSKGDRIEVLSPSSLRDKMCEEHLKAVRRYEK